MAAALPYKEEGCQQGGERKEATHEKSGVRSRIFREIAATEMGEGQGQAHGRPLNRLKTPGETEGTPGFYHERIGHDVGKGQSERTRHEQHQDRCIRRRRNGQRQPACQTQRAHQHEITLAPRAAQGQEVGQQAVDRLDGPTQTNHGPHKAGLTGTQVQVFFEQILNRLIGQTG